VAIVLSGAIESLEASKIGLRYFRFGVKEPYYHSVAIEVVGDPGAEDDNSLTEAMQPFAAAYGRALCEVTATVGDFGELHATPSCFRHVPQ
jgi:hypothetical protein